MNTGKIYCFGDGYAHGHIWPEWPQLLEALFPTHQIIVVSGIGAGPEYLVTQFAKLLPVSGPVIFQWPQECRFDKIIQDNDWTSIVNNDLVYSFNVVTHDTENWWLSSASKSPEILEYHKKFIQPLQAKIRLQVYQKLVEEILKSTGYKYIFTSNVEQDNFKPDIRGNEIQPSPLNHFYFLTEKLMPALNLRSNKAKLLEQLILTQKWVPFDPDRAEIWANIKSQLVKAVDK